MKKLIALLLVAVICLSFAACSQTTDGPADGPADNSAITTEKAEELKITAVGENVSFGTYYYEGTNSKEVTWIVLDIQADKALLISKSALEPKRNEEPDSYGYLNLLATKMFTKEELSKIISTEVNGESSYMFLLSSEDVEQYMPGEDNKLRLAMATGYAIDNGVKVYEGYISGAYCNWVLGDGNWVGGQRGNSGDICTTQAKYSYGIRPAIWVSIP